MSGLGPMGCGRSASRCAIAASGDTHPADPGYRRRGLMTIAAITEQMTVHHGRPDHPGTTVTLLSPATTALA